jgi:hypothetical protein
MDGQIAKVYQQAREWNDPRQHDGEVMEGQLAGVCQEAEVPKGKSTRASSYENDNLSELERVRKLPNPDRVLTDQTAFSAHRKRPSHRQGDRQSSQLSSVIS